MKSSQVFSLFVLVLLAISFSSTNAVQQRRLERFNHQSLLESLKDLNVDMIDPEIPINAKRNLVDNYMGVTAANCSALTNCFDCLKTTSCGWCAGTSKCLAIPDDASVLDADAFECSAELGWHTDLKDCRNCAIYTNCHACSNAYNNSINANTTTNGTEFHGCGWCGGDYKGKNMCFEGTAAGPYQLNLTCLSVSQTTHNSTNHNWRFTAKSCPSDDNSSEKRKLAIIIGLSVAGGLFILAVIATIVFILVKRFRRNFNEYGPINDGAHDSDA